MGSTNSGGNGNGHKNGNGHSDGGKIGWIFKDNGGLKLNAALNISGSWATISSDRDIPKTDPIIAGPDGWPEAKPGCVTPTPRRFVSMIEHGKQYSDAEERELHRLQDELYHDRHRGVFFDGKG